MNGTATDYTLHGKQIVHLTQGSDNLHFFYDAQGKPSVVDFNGTKYGYVHNLQGDVVAIIDSAGTQVVEYTYDSWGKPLTKTGTLATTLGTLNPFRYRGYAYDEETGLYYLRSRYYNPVWGRFVNADAILGQVGGLFSHNVFAYCHNNPIAMLDPTGNIPSFNTMVTDVGDILMSKEYHDYIINRPMRKKRQEKGNTDFGSYLSQMANI